MNVVKIMGGLGNQLFQYALSRHLAQYDSIGYDITYYQTEDNIKGIKYPHRDFLLPCFDVGNLEIVNAEADGRQRINQWEYDPDARYTNCWFWGDWQRAGYFRDVNIDIHLKYELLTYEMLIKAEEMSRCNSVAVHVRRTDYAKYDWLLDKAYYVRAYKRAKKRISEPKFYIFSDDPEWCKDNLPGGQIVHMDELEDFWLMSKCKHQIIANSTYSFWAAYLNTNPEKVVIYPKDWHIAINHPVDCLQWEGV